METVYLDTHIVIWLREKQLKKLSKKAKDAIEDANSILISPIVVLELEYLYEIERIIEKPNEIISDLEKMIGLRVDEIGFYNVIKYAQSLSWTRDAFDRIIVANTIANNSKLITKDQKIIDSFKEVIF